MTSTHAARSPLSPAVIGPSGAVDYRRLFGQAERFSADLIAAGVEPGSLVAVDSPRDLGAVVAALAVWRSDAAYIMLDPEHPDEWRARVAERSGASHYVAVSATQGHDGTAKWNAEIRILSTAQRAPDPRHAYTIMTSGSAGQQKGVVVRRDNVDWLLHSATEELGLTGEDVFTCVHSLAFDFSVWEIYAPLFLGGRVVLVDRESVRSPHRLSEVLRQHGVTVLSATPQLFYALLEHWRENGVPPTLHTVVLGGDRLDPARIPWELLSDPPSLRVANLYGITETTVHVTCGLIGPESVKGPPGGILAPGTASPIGWALPGARVSLRDSSGRQVPVGELGEIWVGGDGVADGYLGDPRRTARVFVPDPEGRGARAYRSGDLARLGGDGILYYEGRIDNEIKVRGHRVAPQQLESLLRRYPGVRDAAVGLLDGGSGGSLTAVIVAPEPFDEAKLFDYLRDAVPPYLMPSRILRRLSLPITTNGKLDRSQLFFGHEAGQSGELAAGSPVESVVADCWTAVLGHREFGLDTTFFECGGDSLLGIRVISRIKKATGRSVPVEYLFEGGTVRGMAQLIGETHE
ncbi:non-ribosomal peptide synthetase [Nonomuraea sp. NPDC049152]|uniref:non-ribosomal peptide synthetase n=1 Tax=Nonomuraea sp. NPDC049152 TaxID=3154350 RepID=UPI0033FB8DD3